MATPIKTAEEIVEHLITEMHDLLFQAYIAGAKFNSKQINRHRNHMARHGYSNISVFLDLEVEQKAAFHRWMNQATQLAGLIKPLIKEDVWQLFEMHRAFAQKEAEEYRRIKKIEQEKEPQVR